MFVGAFVFDYCSMIENKVIKFIMTIFLVTIDSSQCFKIYLVFAVEILEIAHFMILYF